MISYFERSFALDAQESKISALSAWLLLSGLLHVLMLLATGLTLTQEVVLLLQKTTAFLGHHPAAMGTWRENKMNGEKLLLYTRLWYHIDSNLSKCSIRTSYHSSAGSLVQEWWAWLLWLLQWLPAPCASIQLHPHWSLQTELNQKAQ